MLPEIMQWTDHAVNALLDVAENVLYECIENMNLSAQIIKKECAVGIIQRTGSETKKIQQRAARRNCDSNTANHRDVII